MSVTDGQAVNAAVTNAAFVSRTQDSSAAGKINLQEASTTDLIDIQRVVNEQLDQSGLSNQAATDANAKVYSSNNVITDGDNQKVAIGKLDAEFDTTTGHDHDGINSKAIDASALGNFNLLFAEYVADQFTGAAGTSDDVSANFGGKSSGGDALTEGVITSAPGNYVHLIDDADGSEVVDGSGRRVYGRLTEAAGVWTLTYYVNIAGVETSHNLTSANITFFYREVFNQSTRPTIPADLGLFDSVNAVSDIPDASPTQAGKVSTNAQAFAGVKEFNDNPTTGGSDILSTDNAKVVTEKDIDGGLASNSRRITVPKNTRTNLDALTRKEGTVVYSTDEQKLLVDDGVDLIAIGTGGAGGGLDTFLIENFEDTEAADILTGNSATPFASGTIQGTVEDEEVSPLSGLRSIKYTQAAGSLNDWFNLPTYDVAEKNRGKFVAAITNAKYSGDEGDIDFIIWDETNSKILDSFTYKDSASQRYVTLFGMPTTTAQIKVGNQVKVENIGAVLLWDDTELTLNAFEQGDLLTYGDYEVSAIAPSDFSAGFGTVTNIEIFEKKNKGSLQLRGYFQLGSVAASVASFTLPAPYQIDFSRLPSGTRGVVGEWRRLNSAVASTTESNAEGLLFVDDSNSNTIYIHNNPTAVNSLTTENVNALFVGSDGCLIDLEVPVLQFSSNNGVVHNGLAPYNSMARLYFGNGYGSTNTKIRRFQSYTTDNESVNSAILADVNVGVLSIVDTAADGTSIVVNEDGVYHISASDHGNVNTFVGISLNSTELTTNIESITDIDRLIMCVTNNTSGIPDAVATSVALRSGDVIRLHTQGLSGGDDDRTTLTVAKIGTFQKSGFQLPVTAYLRDEKASGVVGGTGSAGAFVTRTLNTTSGDDYFVSLSSNQFTLVPGKYKIFARTPGYFCDRHRCKLRNITDGVDEAYGSSAYAAPAGAGSQDDSNLRATIEISTSKTYEIQHRISVSSSTQDFGVSSSMGINEIYTEVEITKVA